MSTQLSLFYSSNFSSDRREARDHCARVSHQDRGPEQDRGGHEQPEAEAPDGVPGGESDA